MKPRIFLDCGRFDGVAIRQYCIDDSWTIYSWDVDPQKDLDLPPHTFNKQAVWTEGGRVKINLDPLKQASHITGLAGVEYEKTKTVPSFDFSKFVYELPPADVIVCSMDCEGAEFPVLRKMIKDGSINKIHVLDVEFHHRIMPDEDSESARQLIQELTKLGVIVRLKIVL